MVENRVVGWRGGTERRRTGCHRAPRRPKGRWRGSRRLRSSHPGPPHLTTPWRRALANLGLAPIDAQPRLAALGARQLCCMTVAYRTAICGGMEAPGSPGRGIAELAGPLWLAAACGGAGHDAVSSAGRGKTERIRLCRPGQTDGSGLGVRGLLRLSHTPTSSRWRISHKTPPYRSGRSHCDCCFRRGTP